MTGSDDDGLLTLVAIGAALFVVGLLLAMRVTSHGRQIPVGLHVVWPFVATLTGRLPEPLIHTRFDGFRMVGFACLVIGYVLMGLYLVFVAPGWGALVFCLGFVLVVGIALRKAM